MNKEKILQVTKKAVTQYYGVNPLDIDRKINEPVIAMPRHKIAFLLREWKKADGKNLFTLKEVGKFLGGRDHSTVLNSENTISDLIDVYKKEKQELDEIRLLITEALNKKENIHVDCEDYLDQECSEMLSEAGVIK